jgi:hypothetical protein
MLFTPTHVLAVVPIAAIIPRLLLSALAIGSMIVLLTYALAYQMKSKCP